MNQKKNIRWFDTQLETRENLPFRFSGYRPIIINPIKRFNSLNYLPSQGEAAEASEKVHIKCSSLCKKKKKIMLYHPKNNFRYYSMRNLVKTFPFYIDLTTKKYLIHFSCWSSMFSRLVKMNGRNSLLKLPKTSTGFGWTSGKCSCREILSG